MQSRLVLTAQADAAPAHAHHAARSRADTTVAELLKEINTGNVAMKGATENLAEKTENAGTGNVAVIKTVVDSLNNVVAEMKALRRCPTFMNVRGAALRSPHCPHQRC